MKDVILIIALVLCIGCMSSQNKGRENVNEEAQVILKTFENGIVWVSESDFEDMNAENHGYPNEDSNKLRKYTTTDSLFSMDKFKLSHHERNAGVIKKTVAFYFKALKKEGVNRFEIVKTSQNMINADKNYNGNLTFGRVLFNNRRDRAKYYFEQHKSIGRRGWGMGTYIYAKKINGFWVFDTAEEAWIN